MPNQLANVARQCVLALLASGLCACSEGQPLPPGSGVLVERTRLSMGAEVRLTAWTADEAAALRAFEAAFDEFDRLDRLMSVWIEGSDVERVNAAAGGAPVGVSREVLEVLQLAQQVSTWTNGKFDITFGALSNLWRFDHDQDNRVPSRADVRARLPLIDYAAVEINPAARTAFLRRAGMRMHLGGIGKGYAIDRAAAILRSHGVGDFLIQSGGDLYAAGRRADRPWRGAIKDPRSDAVFATLDLSDETFSTSGDYERFFMRDGQRYHHILDPDTGQPARGSRSVTIVARRAALADALSTGVFVMGADAGMALIEKLPEVDGVIVSAANEVRVSSGLKQRVALRSTPTDAP